jgi:hypothetical protein
MDGLKSLRENWNPTIPSAAKAALVYQQLLDGLKAVPFKSIGFFRKLFHQR